MNLSEDFVKGIDVTPSLQMLIIGLTQTTDLLLFAGYFLPLHRQKITCKEKKSTLLPQARGAFA